MGQIRNILDIFVATCLTAAVTFLASFFITHSWLSLILGVSGGLAMMLICLFIFRMDEKNLLVNYLTLAINKVKR